MIPLVVVGAGVAHGYFIVRRLVEASGGALKLNVVDLSHG